VRPVIDQSTTGLVLKNALDSRDASKKEQQAARWLALAEDVRASTKQALLLALGASEFDIGHTAGLVVAKIAAIEIPKSLWPDLLPGLLEGAAKKDAAGAAGRRQSSIELLGYICEELTAFDEDYLNEEMMNAILTGVVTAMNPEEKSMELRCVATKALTNALEFAANNFKREQERNYIMEMVCHGTGAGDARVREASWECLVRVAEHFYEFLPNYIGAIFSLTENAMNDEHEGVMMQALEFWSTIADEEFEISLDVLDGKEDSSYHFIEHSLNQLVPLLLAQLTKQEEIADEGTWNGALAAGAALSLAATVAKDPIVAIVMPYVTENIQKKSTMEDWRFREAATFAFGCILDGPDPMALGELARSGLSYLLTALSDVNPLVKNTTAWCLGRIFEFVHGELDPPLIPTEQLELVVHTLLASLQDELFIAEKVCYAISKLATGYSDVNPSPMTQWFEQVVGKLLETSTRGAAEAGQSNIQIQAFAAINEVVSASSADASHIVAQLTGVVVQHINGFVQLTPTSQEASEQQLETLNLLCGVTSAIITKLYSAGDQASKAFDADSVMHALIAVFSCRDGYVPEDAMLAVGALTYLTGKQFERYMPAFYPFLEKGLQQTREWQTCLITLGILGDVCRALDEGFVPYCDSIMQILARSLEDPDVPKAVKPSILASFGDIAIAIGDNFIKYLGIVAPPLQGAAEMSIQLASVASDEDEMDYVNSLRQNILDAWSGMFNGLTKQAVDQHLKPFTEFIIYYVETIAADAKNEDLSVLNRAVGVLGDAAANITGIGVLFQQKTFVKVFLEYCQTKPGLDEKSAWSLKMVDAALANTRS
jgi:importin subunit beta-1